MSSLQLHRANQSASAKHGVERTLIAADLEGVADDITPEGSYRRLRVG
ncbi:MAG: hypothetical protein KDA57_21535 [Planctomycetales bacterium]|nr:hypothetical protein [Planctomycetales bacterium]